MKRLFKALVAVCAMSMASGVSAGVVFSESFDTDTTSTTETLSTYSAFSQIGTSALSVNNGVLEFSPQGAGIIQGFVLDAGFAGDLHIEVDLGRSNGSSGFNVGFLIGTNNVVFHPGFATPPGAFRVEGPGEFGTCGGTVGACPPNVTANSSMGFIPEAGTVLHHLTMDIFESTGVVEIKIEDALVPTNVFTHTFQNSSYSAGDAIGFTTHGHLNEGIVRFDNFVVSQNVPEPTTTALLALGLFGVSAAARRRKVN